MKKDFQYFKLEDFLLDKDFCEWARSEKPELDEYFWKLSEDFPEQEKILNQAREIVLLFDDEKIETELEHKQLIWDNIRIAKNKPNRKIGRYVWLKYAASIAVLLALGISIFYYQLPSNQIVEFRDNIDEFSETKLILNNSREVLINSDQSEIVYDQKGEEIKVDQKLLKHEKVTETAELNQLIVPFGKQSKIVLADGSKIWINAGSQLSYPSTFVGNKREVYLSGEAFFEVESDVSKPFYVITSDMRIKVTGTRFNVTSYPVDQTSQTVLLSGKVSAQQNKRFASEIDLRPGERLVYTKTEQTFAKDEVNVELFSSWIDGYLKFEDESIDQVVRMLERYYNQNIVVEGNDGKKVLFTGKLDLVDNLELVLENIAFSVSSEIENNGNYYIIRIN